MTDRAVALACACGTVRLAADRAPIVSAECCCTSCSEAGRRLEARPGAPSILAKNGSTHFVCYRKDRVRFVSGRDRLAAFRLSPDASTRRVIATCCDTPVFLEFKGGHWLSLYAGLWPAGTAPAPELRTMTKDLPEGTRLPDDMPNARTQSIGFMARLFAAWAGMGFRNPKIDVGRTVDA